MVLLNILSFSRYAVETVFRNRRRSIYALLGVAIAISLVAGSSIAIDSSVYGMVRAALDPIPVDFVGYDYGYDVDVQESDFDTAIERMESVDGVVAAVPAVISSGWEYLDDDGVLYEPSHNYYGQAGAGSIVFLPSHSDPLLDGYKIDGELPAAGTVAISCSVADSLGLVAGDDIICSLGYSADSYYVNGTYVQDVMYANLTLEIGAVWEHAGEVVQPYDYYYYGTDWLKGDINVAGVSNPVIMNMADVSQLFTPEIGPVLESGLSYLSSTYHVWVDRGTFIDVTDIQGTIERLDYTATRLTAVSPYGITFYGSSVSNALLGLDSDLSTSKLIFIGLSAPVVALGTYLSIVGVELGSSDRRRETGMLKARGASKANVFGSLMLEATVLGAVAGVCGLLGGVLVSRFLLEATSFDSVYSAQLTDLYITPSTISMSVLFAVFLMLASAYRPMKRVARMDIAEALHFYTASTTKIGYKARYDIAALVIVGLNVWTVLYWSDEYFSGSGSFLVSLVILVVFVIGISATPFVPFLLSVGLSRLLTRGPGGLYKRFVVLVRPWTKELHYLVEKNISRNPRRASNICVMVSLAMAFGLVISITLETNIAYSRAVAVDEVGSDIRVTGYSFDSAVPFDADALDAVADLPGVEEYCRFHILDVVPNGYWMRMVAIDPSGYLDAVDPPSSYFVDGGPEMIGDLETVGNLVLSEDVAQARGWQVGDRFTLEFTTASYEDEFTIEYEEVYIDVHLIGLVKNGLPGFSYTQAFASIETLEPLDGKSSSMPGCLVKVADGHDADVVASSVLSVFRDAGVSADATTLEDRLESTADSTEMRSLAEFLYVEYSLAFVIMTAGMGLVVFVTVSDREREIACIMARGSSAAQMRRILMGESMSIMALGLVIGLSAGLASAYLFNLLMIGVTDSPIPHGMVFSLPSYAIVLASVASFVLASYLATARAGKVRLAEVLRVRGG